MPRRLSTDGQQIENASKSLHRTTYPLRAKVVGKLGPKASEVSRNVPGRRHAMDSAGSTYEDCARLLLGRIASLVQVPREKDFGIDFYLQPRIAAGPRTETVAELGSLQVKGGDQALAYGGVDQTGAWREYEFTWLRSIATPLYLARVDAACTAVELFSLWPLWLIFWRQTVSPFEIILTTQPRSAEAYTWRDPQASGHPDGTGKGDGMKWTVDLGPPFLRLTNDDLQNRGFQQRATTLLRTWIAHDRLTLMRYHQFIPVLTGITGWRTDPPDVLEVRTWMFWDSRPGAKYRAPMSDREPNAGQSRGTSAVAGRLGCLQTCANSRMARCAGLPRRNGKGPAGWTAVHKREVSVRQTSFPRPVGPRTDDRRPHTGFLVGSALHRTQYRR